MTQIDYLCQNIIFAQPNITSISTKFSPTFYVKRFLLGLLKIDERLFHKIPKTITFVFKLTEYRGSYKLWITHTILLHPDKSDSYWIQFCKSFSSLLSRVIQRNFFHLSSFRIYAAKMCLYLVFRRLASNDTFPLTWMHNRNLYLIHFGN